MYFDIKEDKKGCEKMTEKISWGFDITDFGSASKFRELLRRHKLLSGYKVVYPYPEYGKEYKRFTWSNKNLLLVTGNNPLTGEYNSKGRRPEKGFASYIGIEGKPNEVFALVKDIKKITDYIKDESKYRRDFI